LLFVHNIGFSSVQIGLVEHFYGSLTHFPSWQWYYPYSQIF